MNKFTPQLRLYNSVNIVAVRQQYTNFYITSGYRLHTGITGQTIESAVAILCMLSITIHPYYSK